LLDTRVFSRRFLVPGKPPTGFSGFLEGDEESA
jgi:hypothetical protein